MSGPDAAPQAHLAIVVGDADMARTEAIARALGEGGLLVDRVVAEAGAIFAHGPSEDIERHIARARGLDGVAEVRREEAVHLPPMEDDAPQ